MLVVVVVVVDVVAILNFGLVALRSAETALANRIAGNYWRKRGEMRRKANTDRGKGKGRSRDL